jgi:hypothetical protein
MLRKILAVFLSVCLCWTAVASSSYADANVPVRTTETAETTLAVAPPSKLGDGKYLVQQGTYNDGDGEYSLMLLNTPAGTPPTFRSNALQMARLSDDEIKAGEKTYLEVKGKDAVMHLTEDFKFEYVHNVTEARTNPQTGETQTVVVRQQSSFWTPFAGVIAGQIVADMLFPRYYVPPVYSAGGMIGYGGYGNTYSQAVQSYRTKYDAPPAAEKNRQVFRSAGNINKTTTSTATKRTTTTNNKSTGSGFGFNRLGSSGKSYSTQLKRPSSFGSGRSMRVRSFGRRR